MSEHYFTVGTYAEGDADSIFEYKVDFEARTFTRLAAYGGTPCPSYLLQAPNSVLYAVEELIPEGNVTTLIGTEGGGLRPGNTLPSGGAHPCHLELDAQGRFLFVANYTSGSLAMFDLDDDGLPVSLCCLKQHTGKGVNPERQEGPHVHFSKELHGLLYVCDLGLDTIFCYRINAEQKTLEDTGRNLRLPDGSGPRHLCIHPEHEDWLFVVGEMTGQVFVYHQEDGAFVLKQEITSLPADAPADNRSAALKLSEDGKYLFVSNRGSDTVTALAITPEGLLELVDICAAGGKAPRDIGVFGYHIVVANQDSSLLTVLHLDRAAGRLENCGFQETVPLPSCIVHA